MKTTRRQWNEYIMTKKKTCNFWRPTEVGSRSTQNATNKQTKSNNLPHKTPKNKTHKKNKWKPPKKSNAY